MYLTLKTIHVSCVFVSFGGFLLRAVLARREAPVMRQRWMRVVPHVIDSLLLASALAMMVMSAQYPFVANWLTAKVLGLIAYVGLGVLALRGSTAVIRQRALIAAIVVFGWMVSVALTRHPAGWLAPMIP